MHLLAAGAGIRKTLSTGPFENPINTRVGLTNARLLHRRRSTVARQAINSSSTKTICGCLLSVQSVIQSERSQSRPCRSTALKQRAVIMSAPASAAPSALSTDRL